MSAQETISTKRASPLFWRKRAVASLSWDIRRTLSSRDGASLLRKRKRIVPIRVFALFASPHVNLEDIEMMEEAVKQAKKDSDVVIVSQHFSISVGGSHTLAPHQEAMARSAIDAGADFVLGHGPMPFRRSSSTKAR